MSNKDFKNEDKQMLEMFKGESALLDLQKEQFSNVRTLITAAAAIASVDLLAFSYLKEIGLSGWFLGSVVLLYLSSIIYTLFLTLSNNVQTKLFLFRSNITNQISKMLGSPESKQIQGADAYLNHAMQIIEKTKKITATMEKSAKMLLIGNILFILGLLIPIIGFIKMWL